MRFTDDLADGLDARAAPDWDDAAHIDLDEAARARKRAQRRREDNDGVGASAAIEDDGHGVGGEDGVLGADGVSPEDDARQRRFQKTLDAPLAASKGRSHGHGAAVEHEGPYHGGGARRMDDPSGAGAGARAGAGAGAGAGTGAGSRARASPRAEYVDWADVDGLGGELDREYKESAAACEEALMDWVGSMEEKGEDPEVSMRRAFQTIDTDEDGRLDAKEIGAALEAMGVHTSRESVLAFVDGFGSGSGVTQEQFMSFALYVFGWGVDAVRKGACGWLIRASRSLACGHPLCALIQQQAAKVVDWHHAVPSCCFRWAQCHRGVSVL